MQAAGHFVRLVQRAGASELTRERGHAYFYPANEMQSERFGAAGGRIFALDLADEYRLPTEVQAAIADYLAGKDVSTRRIALPAPVFRSVEEAKAERR